MNPTPYILRNDVVLTLKLKHTIIHQFKKQLIATKDIMGYFEVLSLFDYQRIKSVENNKSFL